MLDSGSFKNLEGKEVSDTTDKEPPGREPAVDRAPSGVERAEQHVFDRSNVTMPGPDSGGGVTRDTGDPSRVHVDFGDTPAHPDDTTIVDHR